MRQPPGLGTSNVRWVTSYSNPTPGSRRGHTMTTLPKRNSMLLFGGLRGNIFLNDFWQFDIGKGRWLFVKPRSEKNVPSARCFHTAFTDKSQDNFFVLGGHCLEKAHGSVIYHFDLSVLIVIINITIITTQTPANAWIGREAGSLDLQNGMRCKQTTGG
eukprot:jgi/Bigna1/84231/fgenesh1_pg.127_\